eukprot:4871053-Karenia_brevis.AAC.1
MHEHGKLLQELGRKSPYAGSKTNQAKCLSHPGKGPATGIGQPYVVCQYQLENKCPGWVTLEALTLNPCCACGAPFLISRKNVKY